MSASAASSISLRDGAPHSEGQELNEPRTCRKAVGKEGGLCQSESKSVAATVNQSGRSLKMGFA